MGDEYEAEKSWTKQLTDVPSTFPSRVVEFDKDEELILASYSHMYLYDEQLTKAFSIDNNFVHGVEVVNHIESLVTIEETKVPTKKRVQKSVKTLGLGGEFIVFFLLCYYIYISY